jgi:hypothetical protein
LMDFTHGPTFIGDACSVGQRPASGYGHADGS